jgi:hypothetical protein
MAPIRRFRILRETELHLFTLLADAGARAPFAEKAEWSRDEKHEEIPDASR